MHEKFQLHQKLFNYMYILMTFWATFPIFLLSKTNTVDISYYPLSKYVHTVMFLNEYLTWFDVLKMYLYEMYALLCNL